MTAVLRDRLARLADTAPAIDVDPAIWDRGRRARRRDRVVAAASALSLLAVLGGLAALVTGAPGPQPAGPSGEGAVPSRLWGVSERFVDLDATGRIGASWRPEVRETDLATGRASVAFPAGFLGGVVVVVTARDGAYHPLALPAYAGETAGMLLDGTALALSPDGTQLAYAHAEPAAGREDYASVPSGIHVVDLMTGDVREIDLAEVTGSDAQATVAGRLVWSPDGRWLAWAGRRFDQFNASGTASRGPGVAGVVAPGSSRSRSLPADFADHPLAVTDAGEVVSGVRGTYAVWQDGTVRRLGRDLIGGSGQLGLGSVSPDGRHVLLPRSRPGTTVPVLDLRTGQVRSSTVPAEVGRVVAQPLGWIDEGLMVVQTSRTSDEDGAGWSSDAPQVVVMSAPTAAGPPVFRVASRWATDDDPVPAHLSVAVDLMERDRLSRDFPEPDWPWSDERKAVVAAVVLLGLALAAYLCGTLVRRHRASRTVT